MARDLKFDFLWILMTVLSVPIAIIEGQPRGSPLHISLILRSV